MVRIKRVFGIALALSLVWAVPAMAGKPDSPPADAGRDVILEAGLICEPLPTGYLGDACDIRTETYLLEISGNQAERNEDALVKQASSAVLSLDDVFSREKGEQTETAAGYLCSYADKIAELQARNKLGDDRELATSASDLAGALGYPCLEA
jgi:hypothetical protein